MALPALLMGVGTIASFIGGQEETRANVRAAKANAREAEINARLSRERAVEDERQFRLSFKREEARNVTAVAASGVKLEGSPLEVLRDNAANAEKDAQNIRRAGELERSSYLRQAQGFRRSAKDAKKAGKFQGAATLLMGAGGFMKD
jgi:hypothetical protein